MTTNKMSATELIITDVDVFALIESGDAETLLQRLQESEDAHKLLSNRNKQGKNALDLAALLGRADIAKVLVENGAALNKANKSGYTALHKSASWGHLECLRALVSLGADHQLLNKHTETPRDMALRYGKTHCADYLEIVDSRYKLSQAVKLARDTLGNSEKISGKWNKDDRSKVNGLCNDKTDWLQYNGDTTNDALLQQLSDFDTRFEPYLAKLTPPPETHQ